MGSQYPITPSLHSSTLFQLVKLRRIFPQDLLPLFFAHSCETLSSKSLAVGPCGVCRGKVRRPHDSIRADVAGIDFDRVVPFGQVTLAPEHLGGFQLIIAAVLLVLVIGIFQDKGSPTDRALGKTTCNFGKRRRISENSKFTKSKTALAGRVTASSAAASSGDKLGAEGNCNSRDDPA
jgi:hypothetical protein